MTQPALPRIDPAKVAEQDSAAHSLLSLATTSSGYVSQEFPGNSTEFQDDNNISAGELRMTEQRIKCEFFTVL